MSWQQLLSTYIWIFPVGRGSAAFLRTGLNQGFLIDMGGGDLFNPAEFIEKHFVPYLDQYENHNIAQLILSHPHADHIAQCDYASDGKTLSPALLTCPNDNDAPQPPNDEKFSWHRINIDSNNEELIECYKSLYHRRSLPLQTIHFDSRRYIPNLEYGLYYIKPSVADTLHKSDDCKYANTTSIMLYFRHGAHSILFPGDMTPEGMDVLLNESKGFAKRFTKFNREFALEHPEWHCKTTDQPRLKSLLADHGLTILVAPHHGLESCYSQTLYDAMRGGKPQLVVISDRRRQHDGDGKVHPKYRSADGASGLTVHSNGSSEQRYSVSTTNDDHILIVFPGTGAPKVFADKDPEKLLSKMQ